MIQHTKPDTTLIEVTQVVDFYSPKQIQALFLASALFF